MSVRTYVIAVCGDQRYAIAIERLCEVSELTPITRVPCMSAAVRGVVNRRGTVAPLIDLSVKLGGAAVTPGPRTCVLFSESTVEGITTLMGLLVDTVSHLVELADTDIAPAEPGPGPGGPWVRGLAAAGDEPLRVLDLDALLVSAELTESAPADVPDRSDAVRLQTAEVAS